jgi:hypothetical protein
VAVEDVESPVGDLLRRPPGVRLAGEDGDHGVAGLVAVQHGEVPPLPVDLLIRGLGFKSLAAHPY